MSRAVARRRTARTRRAVALALLVVAGLAVHHLLVPPPVPRNLILVSIDTLRADHLRTWGYARATSPHLDRFAAESTRFTQAIAQAPNTLPSHAALMTSLYTGALGFTGENDRIADEFVTLAELLHVQGFATWGFVDGGYVGRPFGFAQGFDHYDDRPLRLAGILANVDAWLDTHSADRFFLFVHCYDVHAPYAPNPPYDTMFEDTPYQGDFEPTAQNLAEVAHWRRTISAEDLHHVIARYDGGIRQTDERVGGFLDRLRRRGLLDSSLVVILSDHGEEFQEHGSMLHWQTYFTPNLHVPLILHVPGRPAGTVDGPVELIDVLPTALELLALPPHQRAMGRSLVARMDGRESGADRIAFAEPFSAEMRTRTVVSSRWQLHHDTRKGTDRLYDIRKDPRARHDVIAVRRAVAARLRTALDVREARIAVSAGANGGRATVDVDAATRAQLRALGYVAD